MTRKELEEFTQALMDGTLSEPDFLRLEEELRANEEVRAFFRHSMQAEIMLGEMLASRVPGVYAAHGAGSTASLRIRRDLKRALFAAAAVVTAVAVIMTLIVVRNQAPSLECAGVPGTHWEVIRRGAGAESGTSLVLGDTLRVRSGMVRASFESGLELVVRGPAVVSFPELNKPVLRSGWLWANSDESDEGLEITTRNHRVRDIGTCFGVRARDDKDVEVHLIRGVVEVSPIQLSGKIRKLKPADDAFLVTASGTTESIPLSDNPFPTLPGLMAGSADYRTTILSQGPVGYWRFDGRPKSDGVFNEVENGEQAGHGPAVDFGQPGVSDRFQGFPSGNLALYMQGHEDESVVANLSAKHGITRQEGAFGFWMRRLPGINHDEILWLAGDTSDGSRRNPVTCIMHARIAKSGRVEFVVESGDFDVLLSSNTDLADGEWHQIVTSWGASAVELYVDGRRVQRVDDFGSLPIGDFRSRYIRFGKPSEDLKSQGKKPFIGWVDEIAVWNRPLSPAEVGYQYAAALGDPVR